MLSLVTPPATEPIDIDTVKTQCNLGDLHTGESDLITNIYIPATRQRAELVTGRALVTQTWDWFLDGVDGDCLEVPRPPLRSVTSIKYYDTAGVLQTWAASNYIVQAPQGPKCGRGRISLAYGVTWPIVQARAGAVQIRFEAGYGAASAVPALLKAGMVLHAGSLFANREDVLTGTIVSTLPGGVHSIYWSYRSHATQRVA